MTIIGFIGSGNIGSTLAKLAVDQGHSVVMANSRGPETLTDLVGRLGPNARAATAEDAAEAAEIAVVTVPFGKYRQVPTGPLAGKIVIDTNNYYPQRDGTFLALEDGSTTSSQLLEEHLPDSVVVKAFNHIQAGELASHGTAAGAPGRRALVIAGDDAEAKATVADLIESFGFDLVDAGPLAESWRFQPDTPAYARRLNRDEMVAALGEATR